MSNTLDSITSIVGMMMLMKVMQGLGFLGDKAGDVTAGLANNIPGVDVDPDEMPAQGLVDAAIAYYQKLLDGSDVDDTAQNTASITHSSMSALASVTQFFDNVSSVFDGDSVDVDFVPDPVDIVLTKPSDERQMVLKNYIPGSGNINTVIFGHESLPEESIVDVSDIDDFSVNNNLNDEVGSSESQIGSNAGWNVGNFQGFNPNWGPV